MWLGNDDNSPTKKMTGGGLPVDIWSRFMKAAHQGLPMADLPGMAGRSYRAGAAADAGAGDRAAAIRSPRCSRRAGPTPFSREDDMRPLIPVAPPRPPVAVAPPPAPALRAARRAATSAAGRCRARRRAAPPAPAPRVAAPPAPRVAAAQPQYAPAPQPRPARRCRSATSRARPPPSAAAEPRPQQTAANNGSGVGNFFSNLFGQR